MEARRRRGRPVRLPDLPAAELDGPVLIGPRLVELCFQTAGLWEAGADGPTWPCRCTSARCG